MGTEKIVKQTTKLVKDLALGDSIMVNFGKGKSSRIINKVTPKDGTVEILLYTENGRRPKLILPEGLEVELA